VLKDFIGEDSETALVPPHSLDGTGPRPASTPTRVSFRPAAAEVGMRVEVLGQKVVAANPQAGLHVLFMTIGSPQPELFHRGANEVYITEGLVKQCASDAQLAAVLCHELGKMVVEREALAGPDARDPDRRPPMEMRAGNAGQFDGVDQVRAAETAKFGPTRRHRSRPLALPDPKALGRLYLTNAGFAEADLEAVAPQLKSAEANFALERQFKTSPPPVPGWNPPK
jgi:hypothetical protein